MIRKDELNAIRGILKRALREVSDCYVSDKKFIDAALLEYGIYDAFNYLVREGRQDPNEDIYSFAKKIFVSSVGIDKKKVDANRTFLNKLEQAQQQQRKFSREICSYKTIIASLSSDGFNHVTYMFPTFFSSVSSNNPVLMYLVVSGIKYNGEHEKTDDLFQDDIDLSLHGLEKKLAQLINDDLSIEPNNADSFISLFTDYLNIYVDNQRSTFEFKDKEAVDKIINRMREYISHSKDFIRERQQEIVEASSKPKSSSENNNSDAVSIDLEPKLDERQILLSKMVSGDLFDLYNRAKSSNNVRALRALRDIDASLDLLLEVGLDDTQDLVRELVGNLSNLEEALSPRIVYFKNSNGGSEYPRILDSISKIPEENRDDVGNTLNSLACGDIYSGRQIQGDLPLSLYAMKACSYRIFYTIVNDTPVVIDLVKKSTSDSEIKNFVCSERFLKKYHRLESRIKISGLCNEQRWTDHIMDNLSNPSRPACKRRNKLS